MNEELQKALASLLGKANDGIDTASDFLVAELPDVIQQLLMWHGIKSAIICTVGLVLLLTIYKQVKFSFSFIKDIPQDKGNNNWCYKYCSIFSRYECTDSYNFYKFFIIVIFSMELFGGLTMLNLTWLQIWVAPKVWLIEYAAKLTN